MAPTTVVPSTTRSGVLAPTVTEASITDRGYDATASALDPPPPWSDLLGARLRRATDGFELRVRLRGGDAPETTDADHTMNIASFYDVDGDGVIDYEVWANVAGGGWGGSYFDDKTGQSEFQERSGVTVTSEGDEVVLRFPLTHLGSGERFRWSVASEWGRYELLGTDAMVRDDLPDADAAADFPGG